MKHCPVCKTVKSYSEFYKHPRTSDGLNYQCIPCQNEYNRVYNLKKRLSSLDSEVAQRFQYAPEEYLARFCRKVNRTKGCWNWTGGKNPRTGYGRFWVTQEQDRLAHRLAYEWAGNKIPDGLTIDHLCSNKTCVNPDHLEPVTRGENTARSNKLKPRRLGYRKPSASI